MKDGVGTEIKVGDTVAYIQTSYGGAVMLKGVVTKVNPKTFRVQPLRYTEWERSKNVLYPRNREGVYDAPGGGVISVYGQVTVRPSKLVVVDGHDWPEYQLFLNLGVVQEPLDNPF